ncbi:retrovirus-related pol polyprotein from transposon TNT 1-94 [Tanacetum coccineum]
MDLKSAFLYGKIEEEVYVCQPPGFEDSDFPDTMYKVEKALYGLHQAPRAWYETLSTYLLNNFFQRGKIDKTLFIKRHKGDILLVQVYVDNIIFGSTKKELCNAFENQDKYVVEILKKFGFTEVKTASTPMENQKPLLKDEDDEEVDVHMYRSMIGSLMYLTSSRPDIMFAVCACARYQVNPKCKKQTVVANSTTEAEYVAASSCYGQVLWIQNQLLDYGYNFMHTKIFIDNNNEFIKSSVENPVQNPSESEDECECDVPDCDDSQTTNFLTFSNPLFDDSTSSDDKSSHEEVIYEMSFITYSNPLFDLNEEIISSELNPIHNEDPDSTLKNDRFDTESYLLESLLNRDTLMASSPKVDSTLDEFAGELKTIPPGIVNTDHEEYISLMEREEIDIFPGPDDSIPSGIESDDYDSEGVDNSTSLPEFESFHVDYPDLVRSNLDVVERHPR